MYEAVSQPSKPSEHLAVTMESKRLATARKYIDHFATLDGDMLSSILADNYVHEFAPASLDPPGPFDRAGFLEYSGRMRDVMTGFPVVAREYVESESSNQVTVWATSWTVFRADAMDDGIPQEDWTYRGEYIFMFYMDESGEKVVRCLEFLDGKGTDDKLRPLMHRARENRRRRAAADVK